MDPSGATKTSQFYKSPYRRLLGGWATLSWPNSRTVAL